MRSIIELKSCLRAVLNAVSNAETQASLFGHEWGDAMYWHLHFIFMQVAEMMNEIDEEDSQ